ncbi:hypothetical protein [Microbacterium radiodurans]|uniref:DUF4097 domain-containing protein n=1 Tax=Microbacterium radiodurans TaxID=661398 RepID=A0A5J5IWW7_9MICO|nr:hypothetical protein [Microbacterium radiodurans]KAA9089776.1 hypothetical protein F6B42_04785 [Microbacterium radiodurans]
MSTAATPDTTPRTTPAPHPAPPTRRPPGARAIAILTAAAGAAIIAVTLGTSAAATAVSGSVETAVLTAQTRGVSALEVDSSAADVEVSFAAVDEATLTITGAGGSDGWGMTRDGDRLVVDSDRDWWSGWKLWGDTSRATLVLPDRLTGLDADLRVGAGAMRIAGDFGALDLTVDAGSLDAAGTATALDTTVSAGRADVQLDGVQRAIVEVSAGRVTGSLTGSAPSTVSVSAEAGGIDLALPTGPYAVVATTEAGSFDNRLTEDAASAARVEVRVSAGSVVLRESR